MQLQLLLLSLTIFSLFAGDVEAPEWDHEKEFHIFCTKFAEIKSYTSEDIDSLKKQLIHPLHLAASNGKLDVVRYHIDILHHEVDLANEQQATPLMFAAQGGSVLVCKYLLDKGAHIHARQTLGKTALVFAIGANHVEVGKLLLRYYTNITDVNAVAHWGSERRLSLTRQVMLYFPFKLNKTYKQVVPLAHYAVRRGNLDLVQECMDKDPLCLMQKDAEGNQPLVYAATNGSSCMVEWLIAKGVKVYHRNDEGKHAAHYVSRIRKKITITDKQKEHFVKIENMLLEPAFLLYKTFGKIMPHEIRREIQKHF